MERQLVTIQRIESLAPIEGADNIEQARVMGWTVVVKKNEFKEGDPCVFFELDSVLPDGAPWAEFMRTRNFRVKTIKLRGVLSQGLALPLDIVDELRNDYFSDSSDVTELLKVKKYEPGEPNHGGPNRVKADGGTPFPAGIPKTDETRLQSALRVLDEMKGLPFVQATKLDGMSATFFRDLDGTLIVASRNWTQRYSPDNAWWKMAERYQLAERLPAGMALQGELCGPGIQKNRLQLTDHDVFMFNAYDVQNGRFLDHEPFVALCEQIGVKTVPVEQVIDGETAERMNLTLEKWLDRAKGNYVGTSNRKEGIVVRPLVNVYSHKLQGRLSFKVINNDFLLKDE